MNSGSSTDQNAGQSGTDWSMVLDAGDSGSPTQGQSIEALVRRYVSPLRAFVRASGHTPEEANDVVQGFMADVLLRRRFLAVVDPSRGRFRNLLFRAIKNYMIDLHRRLDRPGGRPDLHVGCRCNPQCHGQHRGRSPPPSLA